MKIMIVLVSLLFFPVPDAMAGDYIIGEGDTLMISVWGEKDLSISLKVRPDGKITVPLIGEVVAADHTAADLEKTITTKLSRIIRQPAVTVIVAEATNNKVYVFGSGVKPGVYSLDQRATLLQLLCLIENAKDADLESAYVLRNEKKIKTDFSKLFIEGEASEDIVLEPKDVIFIPMNLDKNVYVMGAVATPKPVAYREGLTVMDAILEAGGFTKFASPNDTVIYRKRGGRDVAITVKLKNLINKGDVSQNQRLKAGDYIVVKESIF